MAETLETQCENPSNIERCTEALRERIVSQEEKIADAVEEASEMIEDKFDWRHYVGQAPYLSLGVAAGLGLLASRMLTPEPPTTMEKVSGFIQEASGNRIGNFLRSRRQRTILSSLGGLALTLGAGLAKRAVMNALVGGASSACRRAPEPEPPLSVSS
jgi:ElaB/YqjD/DUF883 family membrane-anchored ribosome-binding protein